MFTHRGAYLNALGEMMEHGLNSRSVYLWTVPLFHCNGWCFSWAVTAAGARNICQRQVDPKQIVELIRSEGVTHLGGAPVVVSSLTQYCATQRHPLRAGVEDRHRGRAAFAGGDPRGRRDRSRRGPRLRPDRNLWSAFDLRLARRMGRAADAPSARSSRRGKACRTRRSEPTCAWWTRRCGTCPPTAPPWAK